MVSSTATRSSLPKRLPLVLYGIRPSTSTASIPQHSYYNLPAPLPCTSTSPAFMAGKSTPLAFRSCPGLHPGQAPGRIRTGTSSSRGLNPLGERVPTACLFPGPRGFIGAPARADPCTEPGRHFMSARTSPDSRRVGVNHVEKDCRLSRVDARPPPWLTSRPCPLNSGS